jgi:hypothetical protein
VPPRIVKQWTERAVRVARCFLDHCTSPIKARSSHLDRVGEVLARLAVDSIGEYLFKAHLMVLDQVLVHDIFGGERWHVDLRADVRDDENIIRT